MFCKCGILGVGPIDVQTHYNAIHHIVNIAEGKKRGWGRRKRGVVGGEEGSFSGGDFSFC